ncbi:hypothetical protein TNCV_565051 [Trichonephila clavipes]|nr:hypothetical protein TNCV_565051 [Trichonephila clavipes]
MWLRCLDPHFFGLRRFNLGNVVISTPCIRCFRLMIFSFKRQDENVCLFFRGILKVWTLVPEKLKIQQFGHTTVDEIASTSAGLLRNQGRGPLANYAPIIIQVKLILASEKWTNPKNFLRSGETEKKEPPCHSAE